MKTIKIKLTLLVVVLCSCIAFGQNLIDSNSWVPGANTNQIDGFGTIGSPSENIIETAFGPANTPVTVWRVIPSSSNIYRGLVTKPNFNSSQIIPQRDYRFTVWIKLINGNGGRIVAQIRGANDTHFLNASDANAQAAYFNWGAVPAAEGWYLMVCFINGMNNTDLNLYDNDKGFWNPSNNKVIGLSGPGQYRFNTTSPNFDLAYTLLNEGGANENMMFYNPRLEEVNGSMPTISELITQDTNPDTGGGGEGGLWSSNGNNIHYIDGKVGIGTSNPDQPLTVNGQIHATEVKVDANVPAPDYVFYKDYDLKSLEEIKAYIDQYGHLPNIPSAKEIEANGIKLGLMNMKLLEKIEELTLYILEHDKKQKQQAQKQQQLELRIKALENQN